MRSKGSSLSRAATISEPEFSQMEEGLRELTIDDNSGGVAILENVSNDRDLHWPCFLHHEAWRKDNKFFGGLYRTTEILEAGNGTHVGNSV